MNIPPLFRICRDDPAVSAVLGAGNECRLYPFGMAPQNVIKPYAVWQGIGGAPENLIDERPVLEHRSLQIDVYADTDTEAMQAAQAIERAIETRCYITNYRGTSRDTQTLTYRVSFDCAWFTER